MDTFAIQPPIALAELAMDPRDPLPYRTHARPRRRPADGRDRRARAARRPRLGADAAAAPPHGRRPRPATTPGAGARATLPGADLRVRPRSRARSGAEPAIAAQLDAVAAAVAPSRAGDYPNFVEEQADASAFFDADTWERLQRVKALYDPQDLFRGNHHIAPANRA